MINALLFSVLAIAGTSTAADTSHCDATPFTLGKPAVAPAPKPVQAAPKAVATAPKPVAVKSKPVAQRRLLATCKDGKGKKSG